MKAGKCNGNVASTQKKRSYHLKEEKRKSPQGGWSLGRGVSVRTLSLGLGYLSAGLKTPSLMTLNGFLHATERMFN